MSKSDLLEHFVRMASAPPYGESSPCVENLIALLNASNSTTAKTLADADYYYYETDGIFPGEWAVAEKFLAVAQFFGFYPSPATWDRNQLICHLFPYSVVLTHTSLRDIFLAAVSDTPSAWTNGVAGARSLTDLVGVSKVGPMYGGFYPLESDGSIDSHAASGSFSTMGPAFTIGMCVVPLGLGGGNDCIILGNPVDIGGSPDDFLRMGFFHDELSNEVNFWCHGSGYLTFPDNIIINNPVYIFVSSDGTDLTFSVKVGSIMKTDVSQGGVNLKRFMLFNQYTLDSPFYGRVFSLQVFNGALPEYREGYFSHMRSFMP